MVIQPLTRNPYNGYINPYYWVDDHPLLYENNGSLDAIAHMKYMKECKESSPETIHTPTPEIVGFMKPRL